MNDIIRRINCNAERDIETPIDYNGSAYDVSFIEKWFPDGKSVLCRVYSSKFGEGNCWRTFKVDKMVYTG